MSVHVVSRANDTALEVRWRDVAGANRSRRFDDWASAEDFDGAMVAAQEMRRARERWAALSPAQREWAEAEISD